MVIARQSTARTVIVGPILDADGVAVTDSVVGDLKISKNGAAPAALNGSATLTHRATGHYSLALTTSDTDTVGQAEIISDDTVNAMPVKVLTVVEEAVYDALFVASAPGYVANAPVNVAQFGGSNLTSASGIPEVKVASLASSAITAASIASDAITAAKIADGAIDAATFAAGAINAAAIAADAITDAKVASDVTIASVTGAVGSVTGAVGSVTGNVGGNVTGSVGSVASGGITAASFAADAITAAKIAADVTTELQSGLATAAALTTVSGKIDVIDGIVDDILVDTAEIGAAGAGLTAVPWNAAWDAEVQSEATDALNAYDPPTRAELTSDVSTLATAAALATVDTVVDAVKVTTDRIETAIELDGSVYRFTTNALEQAPTGGGAADGSGFTAIPWNAAWDAEVQSEVADALAVYDPPTHAELTSGLASADDATLAAIAALNNLSSAQVNAEVDTALADVGLTTTITGRIDAAVSTRATPAQVATELGTYDAPTKAELDAAVATLATAANLAAAKVVVDAIKLKTDLIPSDPAETSDIPSAATVAAAVLAAAASNPIDANVQEINDVALTGDGSGTPWGPA